MDINLDIIIEMLEEDNQPFWPGDLNYVHETQDVILFNSGDYGFTILKTEYLQRLRERQINKILS